MQMQQCPHCGAAIPATDRFCGECGKPIDAPAAQVAPPPMPETMPTWQPPSETPVAPPAWQPQASPLATTTQGAIDTQNLTSRENLAIASLVVGVINLCAWFLPICGLPLALVGIGLGVYAMNSRNRTMAIIGIVLSGLGLIATIINAALGAANALG